MTPPPPEKIAPLLSIWALVPLLRVWADGFSATRAAVELLVAHDSWLRREDFLSACVVVPAPRELVDPERPLAYIDWDAAAAGLDQGRLPASSSMVSMLRIATSLAEGHPLNLRDAVLGLDATNTAIVVEAIVTASQHEDRITTALAERELPPWLRDTTAP